MIRRSERRLRHHSGRVLQCGDRRSLATDPRLLRLAADILGAGAQPYGATLFDKSPDSNWLVAWHQDTALPRRQRDEAKGWGPWSEKDGV